MGFATLAAPIGKTKDETYIYDWKKNSWDKVENENDIEYLKKKTEKRVPKSNGSWSGEIGNSKWIPKESYIPKKFNSEQSSWEDILGEENGVDYKDGFPDFKKFSVAEVEIEGFSSDRASNFALAEEKLIEKIGGKKVLELLNSNLYTWHEVEDCKTLILVPRIIHGNITHTGGVSIIKGAVL